MGEDTKRRIPLTQGKFAIVDDADYDWLNQYRWCVTKFRKSFYAMRNSPKEKGKSFVVLMSRQILGLKRGDSRQADHRNHNTLDNRLINLRSCTNQENQRNRKSGRNSSSVYKGVCWRKDIKKWTAYIRINKKLKHLGFFISEKEAALTYNIAAKKYFGEFAYLNLV